MRRDTNVINTIDWLTVLLYGLLVILGWLNIYAAVYSEELTQSIFNFSLNSGKQLVWIGVSLIIIVFIMVIDFRFYESFAYGFYGIVILLLLLTLTPLGKEVSGAKSWLDLGIMQIQPSEFAKFATALAVAKYLNAPQSNVKKFTTQLMIAGIVTLPVALIALQPDLGTVLIFSAFLPVLYREGLSPALLITGAVAGLIFVLTLVMQVESQVIYLVLAVVAVGFLVFFTGKKTLKRGLIIGAVVLVMAGEIFSVDYVLTNVLKPHQRNRILVLVNPDLDPQGAGYNVLQSKIAIGSGGFAGKGFLNGTQTKFEFVPEQSTDFIFCTIGEEHGFIGSLLLHGLFLGLLLRLVYLAERQKSRFSRIYGYSVIMILFTHFAINIGMTIGLFPIIGIPLPFFSYGGSALFGFTILLFIFLKLDAHRMQVLVR